MKKTNKTIIFKIEIKKNSFFKLNLFNFIILNYKFLQKLIFQIQNQKY